MLIQEFFLGVLKLENECIFCKIASKRVKSRLIWESSDNLAFLTPFPNVAGFTVLASKTHKPSDIFELNRDELTKLILDAKDVSLLLKERLAVERVGLIFEGYGINHAHIKLVPMHGIGSGSWRQISSSPADRRYYEVYPGFIASHDGPAMDEGALNAIHERLIK